MKNLPPSRIRINLTLSKTLTEGCGPKVVLSSHLPGGEETFQKAVDGSWCIGMVPEYWENVLKVQAGRVGPPGVQR